MTSGVDSNKQLLGSNRFLALFLTLIWCLGFSMVVHGISPPLGHFPNFSRIQFDQKESVGEVRSITQDSKGFIWLGGKNGLARYDGYRIKHYSPDPTDPNSLSSNVVHHVYEDRFGEFWIATEGGGILRLNREKDNFIRYQFDVTEEAHQLVNIFRQFFEDSDGNLWALGGGAPYRYDREDDRFQIQMQGMEFTFTIIDDMTEIEPGIYLLATNVGVYKWQKNKQKLTLFKPDDSNDPRFPSVVVRSIYKDSSGRIWVGHQNGLAQFLPESESFRYITLPEKYKGRPDLPIWDIMEDKDGIIWLSSDGVGLLYMDPTTGEVGQYTQGRSESSLLNLVVRTAFQDRTGDLWIGHFPSGVSYYDRSNDFVQTYRNFAQDSYGIFRNSVWAFEEDAHGNLWIGVSAGGLNYFDRQTNSFSQTYNGLDLNSLNLPNAILSTLIDRDNNLWFGTWSEGVGKINLDTMEYTSYAPELKAQTGFTPESVLHIMEDSRGDIWFTSILNGISRYNKQTGSFDSFRVDKTDPHSLVDDTVWYIYEDHQERIWVGTNLGLNLFDRATGRFTHFRHQQDHPRSLSHEWVQSIFQDSKERIWVSTSYGLNLFNEETQDFTRITQKDGLPSDDVVGVQEDEAGHLWISTGGGIARFDVENREFKTYTRDHWLQDDSYNRGAFLTLSSGEMAFGGINGFSLFHPAKVQSNDYIPPVYLSELSIFNQQVDSAKKGSPLKKDILETDSIEFKFDQSMITFTFTALNYRIYKNNQYQYKLEGFDKNWIDASNVNTATYTNLDPGYYTFKVKASNSSGLWNPEPKTIKIVVHPPVWKTWWAYSLYGLILCYFMARYYFSQKQKIAYEKEVNNRLMEVDKLKDQFLANTSHELRTPLNGIIGMSEAMLEGTHGTLTKPLKNDLSIIISSARRLSNLVNDILDFSKISHSKLHLNIRPTDLNVVIKVVIAQFKPLLEEQNIKLVNQIPPNLPMVLADEDRLQQILHNLIGNAVKFTEQGSVTLSVNVTERHVNISVKDTGIGMENRDLERIFQTFGQVHNSGVNVQNGTGLGLSVTKQLVELQGGNISVTSEKGVGSDFRFTLPILEKDLKLTEVLEQTSSQPSRESQTIEKAEPAPPEPVSFFAPKEVNENTRYKVLVVDDESVNRQVLRHFLLNEGYSVYEAKNGDLALQALDNGLNIDLILLDIMMPKISGFDVCKIIRKKYSQLELPIIFVSAKSQANDTITGYEVGGSDFLMKPVNRQELYARVALHIRLTQKKPVLE